MNNILGRCGILMIVTWALSGCAPSIQIKQGVELGEYGQKVADQARSTLILGDEDFYARYQGLIFWQAYSNVDRDIWSETARKVQKNQENLILRARLLENLSKSYAGLQALAGYDAPGEFNKTIGALVKSANALITSTGGTSLNSQIGDALPTLGGIIAAEIQKDKVVAASKKIHATIDGLITHFAKPDIRIAFVSSRNVLDKDLQFAVRALIQDGFVSFRPLVTNMGKSLGVETSDNFDRLMSTNCAPQGRGPCPSDALVALLKYKSDSKEVDIAKSYDETLLAFGKLAEQHQKLENGQIIDADTLQVTLENLNLIADSIKNR